MKQKVFTLLTLLVLCVTGAWADVIYSTDVKADPTAPATASSGTGNFATSAVSWASAYSYYFTSTGSSGQYTLTFSSSLDVSSYTDVKVKVYWGATSNRPLNLTVNGGDATKIDEVASSSDRSKVREAESAISATSISSLKFSASGGAGIFLFRIEITGTSSKTTPTLNLNSTSGSKDIANGRTFNFSTLATVSSTPDVTAITDNIKYRSSDPAVAAIDETTGAVTLKKAGSTTITAYFEGDATYNEAEVDYTLTVTSSADFTADLRTKSSGSYGIAADGSEVAVDNPSAVVTLTMSGYNGGQHGWNPGTVITVPVTGPTKLVLGTCQYGSGDVTVKNSGDETVLSFNTKGSCDNTTSENHFVTRYYEGDATTLTITVNNYLPYVAVSAVGEDQIEYTIDFDISTAGATGSISPVNVTKGSDFVIPANNSLYKAGKTLKSWTNAAASETYNIGESIVGVTSNITLTPNFESNEISLDELTADATVNFNFAQGEGAPVMVASGGGSTMRVAQATVATKSIDVLLNVTSTTKFNNNQGAESAQIVATSEIPTTIQIPGVAGMTVTMNYNFATSYLGEETTNVGTWADGKTTWTYDGASNPVTLTIIADGYPSLMTVTYPAKPTCETPTITPTSFTSDNQEVTISSTAGATIYYTTDGTDPTTSSAVYDSESKPTVSSTTTFKAFAVKDGAFDSSIATQTVTRTVPATWGSWYFTNWSSATQTGILADGTNWDNKEKSGGLDWSESNAGRSNKISLSNNTIKYGSTTVEETNGLKFTAAASGMALLFNLPSTDIGTYHGSQYIWLYSSSTDLIIPNVPAGATIKIGIESHKTTEARQMNVSNASPSSASVDDFEEKEFTVSATGNVTISPNSKGMHIYYVVVTANVATEPISTASGKNYATYVTTNPLDFSSVSDDIKAYVAADEAAAGKITFTGKDAVPAGTPLLIKTTSAGATVNVPVTTSAPAVGTNKLVAGGGTIDFNTGGKYCYILSNGVFRPANASPVAANKAYLALDAEVTANELTISFDDEEGDVTGISEIEKMRDRENETFFNLAGQRVNASHKGIVIVNGKKYLNK